MGQWAGSSRSSVCMARVHGSRRLCPSASRSTRGVICRVHRIRLRRSHSGGACLSVTSVTCCWLHRLHVCRLPGLRVCLLILGNVLVRYILTCSVVCVCIASYRVYRSHRSVIPIVCFVGYIDNMFVGYMGYMCVDSVIVWLCACRLHRLHVCPLLRLRACRLL